MHSITIKVAKRTITVIGAKGMHAGRVQVDVKGGRRRDRHVQAGLRRQGPREGLAATDKGDIKALKRALANTTFLGGFEAGGSGTVVLPKAGDYSVFSFASRGIGRVQRRRGEEGADPKTDGKITARSGPIWAGSSTLPAKGSFLFRNADRTVPHFVILQQVSEGTTTDQVLTFLQSEEGPPPFLGGALETASLNPGTR